MAYCNTQALFYNALTESITGAKFHANIEAHRAGKLWSVYMHNKNRCEKWLISKSFYSFYKKFT